ncbi:molybdate transport system substrate-binding protein [Rhizobium sp. RU35A]|uniref:Molybdate ABC transporter substrate-binding protein n=1 Tax=Rhizobium straminoryzae TaxID=1387186 RepID=A0A549T5I0_9HYPH|nr:MULTISPECIES: molybdate ABC transporter substrate-binding protein [Rhizobium]TRL37080.1 molybdate ABC transporter substrate-binding protein [Rhizobium straminoryzae]SIQ70743.1 molybdate transport system substrate-binding protein [Rhizobium sp. RU35A]
MFLRRHCLMLFAALSASILSSTLAPAQAKAEGRITVFAAASMKTALDAANAAFTKEKGVEVTVSYAASSALAKQIESGAPADLFISADQDWMNEVAGKKLIRPETRTDLLGNRIVLVAAKAAAHPVEIKPGFDLKGLLGDGRLAMGAVESVPAGKYGKAALQKLGVWDSVSSRVAGAENVRAALALVSRGEAPYGIVYATDAAAEPGVAVVGTFPEDTHPPIIYPVALLTDSKNAAAADYLAFLKSPAAASFFQSQGFTVLK